MAINYGIFFTKGSTIIRLPINPEELPDSLEGNNETYDILGIGEVTALRTPLPRTIDIEGLFPAYPAGYVLTPNKFLKPEEYIKFFRDAMTNRDVLIYTPVRYMEDGTPFATDDAGFKCTVESFEVTEKGGETGDFYYTLSIKEYRDYTPQSVKVSGGSVFRSVVVEKKRSIPNNQVVVGTLCVAKGTGFKSAKGSYANSWLNSVQCKVVRIEQGTSFPYYVEFTVAAWSAAQYGLTGTYAYYSSNGFKRLSASDYMVGQGYYVGRSQLSNIDNSNV